MKIKRTQSKLESLQSLCRIAGAVERRGNTIWTIESLAQELGWPHRKVCRYLADLRELGLQTDRPSDGADKLGTVVVGKWRFLDQVKRLMM